MPFPTLLKAALPTLVMTMAISGVFIAFIGFLSSCPVQLGALRVAYKVRTEYLQAVYRQDRHWHDKHKPGEVLSSIGAEIVSFQDGIGIKLVRRINTRNT